MLDNYKKVTLSLAGIFCFFGFLLFINSALAAASTIRGKAYWENYDYLYFHCVDDVIGNRLGEANNLSGAGRYVDPATEAFHFYSEPCSNNTHGVYVDEAGRLSGEAWNPSFGYITFEHDGLDPPGGFGSFNAPCLDACNPSRNCIAC